MKISTKAPYITRDDEFITLSSEVEGPFDEQILWIKIPIEFEQYIIETSADWIVTSLLMPAMLRNLSIEIEGSVSPLSTFLFEKRYSDYLEGAESRFLFN